MEPVLKDILLLNKLATSEVIFIDDKTNTEPEQQKRFNINDKIEVSEMLTYESLLSP